MKKRLLSLLLCLAMMLSFSSAALATDETGTEKEISDFAEISDTIEGGETVSPEETGTSDVTPEETPESVVEPEETPESVVEPEETPAPTDCPDTTAEPTDSPELTDEPETGDGTETEEPAVSEEPTDPIEEEAYEAGISVLFCAAEDFCVTLRDADGNIIPAEQEREPAEAEDAFEAEETDGTEEADGAEDTAETEGITTEESNEAEAAAEASAPMKSTHYRLTSGTYTYTARIRSHMDANGTIEAAEEGGPMVIELSTDAYPYGLSGLPIGYTLSAEEAAAKLAISDEGLLDDLNELTPGENYTEDELFFYAADEQTALIYAEAYNAEVVSFDEGITVIRLDGISVTEALTAAADPEIMIPAAEPNYIMKIVPVSEEYPGSKRPFSLASAAKPAQSTWYNWYSGHSNRDPFLSNPSSADYQYMHEVINTYGAWGITTGSKSVKVAVIDSGINTSHVEFSGKIWKIGYYSSYSSVKDDHGHGTHCAGIIAGAMNNGCGGSGIAPGVELMAYKALDSEGAGTRAAIAAGIRWAANNGADVINLSLGSYSASTTEKDAITYAVGQGCTVVTSIGNDGSNIKNFPAGYNIPGMVVVGATDRSNTRAYYSNTGSWEDILAPGSSIYSASAVNNNDFVYKSGSSMSSAVVAGVCALYISCFGHRGISPVMVEKAIKAGKTNGIVDAWKVVSKGYSAGSHSMSITCAGKDETAYCLANNILPKNFDVELAADENNTVIYTLDGTYPCTENGSTICGTVCNGKIDLSDCPVGEEITLTSMSVAQDGTMGDIQTHTFTLGESVDIFALKLEGGDTVAADGTLTLKAVNFKGEYITENLSWSVETPKDCDESLTASISQNGVLEAWCNEDTVLTIRAYSADGLSGTKTVSLTGLGASYIQITGPSPVLIGKSASYKLYVNGKAVSATWTVSDYSGYNVRNGYVKIDSKGKVSANKYADPNGSIRITGKAKNGSGSTSLTVPVRYPVSKVTILPKYSDYGCSYTYNSKGVLTGIKLYCQNYQPIDNKKVAAYLSCTTTGNTSAGVNYKSSNPSVASVSSSGYIVAGKAGKAVITATAADGSGKKATVTVTVVTPASRISISTTAKTMNGSSNYSGSIDTGDYVLAVGKSTKIKATFGDDYGKPSSTKWRVAGQLYRVSSSSSYTPVSTSQYISISSSGKVSVKKTIKNAPYFYNVNYCYVLELHAETTDGTGLTSEPILFNITTPVAKMLCENGKTSQTIHLYRSWWELEDMEYSMYSQSYHFSNSVTISSSNPAVAGAVLSSQYYNNASLTDMVTIIAGEKTGKATITIKAADGSGKACKYIVVVH